MSRPGIERLLHVMTQLRHPDNGCPWDIAQTFSTIAPYTIEEAYEVADAIAREDTGDLRDELGDLLLQVVFHAQMAEESGMFDFDDVANGIADKMLRRHPHVFGDAISGNGEGESTDPLNQQWENQKALERSAKASSSTQSALDGVALNLPALTRAEKVQKRAQRVGFDWTELPPVVEKVTEELAEVMDARAHSNQQKIDEEVGDLLFAVVNLARHLQVDPETALRTATRKFSLRFQHVERLAENQNITLQDASLAQLDALWDEVKALES